MSIRSLIEINHDLGGVLGDDFLVVLGYYLKSGSKDDAEHLRRFGVSVVGQRHHSSTWMIDGTPDGFPAHHVKRRPAKPPAPPEGREAARELKPLTDADVGFFECP